MTVMHNDTHTHVNSS